LRTTTESSTTITRIGFTRILPGPRPECSAAQASSSELSAPDDGA
jgi:hypothetical protein